MIEAVKQRALEKFQLRVEGSHGLSHWERVRENGLSLANNSRMFCLSP